MKHTKLTLNLIQAALKISQSAYTIDVRKEIERGVNGYSQSTF